jgi:SF3a60/Prp9 C-terminal
MCLGIPNTAHFTNATQTEYVMATSTFFLVPNSRDTVSLCRCLGIPNTAHFANVTQIEDAMALWEKLKAQKFEEAWKPEQVLDLVTFF